MNTYTENLTLGEFETMHTLAQTITPKAENTGTTTRNDAPTTPHR
jgi:hypothetical protein